MREGWEALGPLALPAYQATASRGSVTQRGREEKAGAEGGAAASLAGEGPC